MHFLRPRLSLTRSLIRRSADRSAARLMFNSQIRALVLGEIGSNVVDVFPSFLSRRRGLDDFVRVLVTIIGKTLDLVATRGEKI